MLKRYSGKQENMKGNNSVLRRIILKQRNLIHTEINIQSNICDCDVEI